MYSCVVKTCKNSSVDVTRETGVTFHKFPTDVSWRYKWIQVVRACRHEELWLPTKFSVLCSAHFEEGDIYTTQDGNRHITQNAIPKLTLFDDIPQLGPDDDGNDDNKVIFKLEPTETSAAPSSVASIDPFATQQDPEVDEGLVDHPCLYKDEINKKNEHLLLCRTKIRIQHDRLRRYKNRKLKLRSILEEIKTRKLIDERIFRQLTAGLNKNDK